VPNDPMRIQLIGDSTSVRGLSEVAVSQSIEVYPSEVPMTDQRFGLGEVAALIAIVHTAAQIADLLVKTYQTVRSMRKMTIKTPKASVTIEIDDSTSRESILKQLDSAGVR
jgi:hypothetical protein